MQVLVNLARCQSYGQCVSLAPDVFAMPAEEVLEWDYSPDDREVARVRQAATACPVQAIEFGDPAGAR